MNLSQIVFTYLSHRFSTEPTKIGIILENKVLHEMNLSKMLQIRSSCSTKVLFTELNSAIALAIVHFEFPAHKILPFMACLKAVGTPASMAHFYLKKLIAWGP